MKKFADEFLAMIRRAGLLVWLYIALVGYAAFAVWRAVGGDLVNDFGATTEGKFHVIFWTLAPPIWFFLEYHLPTDEGLRGRIAASQASAARIWAAVVAVLVYSVSK